MISPPAKHWIAMLCAIVLIACAGCTDFALVGVTKPDANTIDAATADSGLDGGPDAWTPGVFIDGCTAGNVTGLDATDATALFASATPDVSQRWLYPYAQTVFPLGVQAPLLMWEGPSADFVLLRVQGAALSFIGCLVPTADGQLALPEDVWTLLATRGELTADDVRFDVQLVSVAAGRATGAIGVQLVLAPTRLDADVYYMSYPPTFMPNPVLVRARVGEVGRPLFGSMGCTACHAVAADGSRFISYSQGFGIAFNIGTDPNIDPAAQLMPLPGGELTALFPDGSVYVAPGHPPGVGPRTFFGAPQTNATLIDTVTGQAVTSANIPIGATTPAFSPDGTLLAFNDFALGAGHGLALMDFSISTRTASNHRALIDDSELYPAWPTFLPDNSALVFAQGRASDFSAGGAGFTGKTAAGEASDLYLIDTQGGAPLLLARAMGFDREGDADATSDLPFGAADLHQSYYPSVFGGSGVMGVAGATASDYHWVFFDSMRHYGNQGVRRQIWVAAIDASADGRYISDPSHPPFYLPGQNVVNTNIRAVPTLPAER